VQAKLLNWMEFIKDETLPAMIPSKYFFVVVAQADKLRARQNQERHIKVSRTKLERRAGFTRLQECAYV
jgi:hypothetical protein